MNGLSPEDELLLLLARGRLTQDVQARAESLLEQGVSWPAILRQAQVHGVFPFLHRNLRALGFPGVPDQTRTELETLSKFNAFRRLLLVEELVRVLRSFRTAGIQVIPLKGVALSESLYGDPTLRVSTDIDLLVPRPAVARAFGLLQVDGYRPESAEPHLAALFLRRGVVFRLVRQARGIRHLLELHSVVPWGLSVGRGATEDLWAEARPRPFFGIEAWAPSPEWELLFLAAHAAHHHWDGLKWLVDIHEVCSRSEINWEKVKEKAERFGYEDVLKFTLSACRALLGTSTPLDSSLKPLPPWFRLFPTSTSSTPWMDALLATRLLKSPSARIWYLARLLFVPSLADHQLFRLPSFLGFLYYPLRPLRLACSYGWWAIRAGFQPLVRLLSVPPLRPAKPDHDPQPSKEAGSGSGSVMS